MKIKDKIDSAQELGQIVFQFQKQLLKSELNKEINLSEFRLLAALKNFIISHQKGVKVSDLSNHLEITPARVTHMINSLEKNHYVERSNDQNDRRIVLIKLTEKGNIVIDSMLEHFNENFKSLSNYLGEKDTNDLIRILTSAINFFKERRIYATN